MKLLRPPRSEQFCRQAAYLLLYAEASLTLGALVVVPTPLWALHAVVLLTLAGVTVFRLWKHPEPAAFLLLGLSAVVTLVFAGAHALWGWWVWALALTVFAVFRLTVFPAALLLLGIDLLSGILLPAFDRQGLIFLWVQVSVWATLTVLSRQNSSVQETRQQAQQKLLETLIDLIPIPLFYKTKTGKFFSANLSFGVVLDVAKDQLTLKTNTEALGPQNGATFDKIDLDLLSRESMAAEEIELLHADGTLHSFILYVLQFEVPENEDIGFLGVLIDITSRKEREQKLEDLNATKDKLFSIISHDLRGPVSKIKQLLDIWVDDQKLFDPPAWDQIFQDMRRSSESLLQLLENLLSWARLQKGDTAPRLTTFPLDPLVKEVFTLFQLMARDKAITLKAELHLNTQIHSDKTMLATILRNLVHNALKFTRPGGQITVTGREISGGAELSVTDTGVGISKENLERLRAQNGTFTTTGTAREQGQGLGLTVCFDMARQLGATLQIESLEGVGTTFRLPLMVPELEDLSVPLLE
ncbi:MAG: PAS domain S-box protein [Spirochaetales bacterium]|nr:PAS domain S-box protein [Spirochaetales bacterium]